ncbi:MAG: hypothetical protein QXK88_01420 [Desulfurococcaceae archaeon]
MDAKTAPEKMREKKILYAVRTPQGEWVSVYKPAMLRAHVDDRENAILLDSRLLLGSPDEQPCYLGIVDCTDKGTHIYTFLEKLDKILIYPRYKTIEERPDPDGDRLVIERFDGVRFRIEPGALLNVIANIEANPGITLGDLHGIIATIYARDVPGFFGETEEALRKNFAIAVGLAMDVGFLYYEADLVELKFL